MLTIVQYVEGELEYVVVNNPCLCLINNERQLNTVFYYIGGLMIPDYDTWLSTLPEPKPEHDFDIDDREYENALEDEWEKLDEIE